MEESGMRRWGAGKQSFETTLTADPNPFTTFEIPAYHPEN
jgi:hypothetical protein